MRVVEMREKFNFEQPAAVCSKMPSEEAKNMKPEGAEEEKKRGEIIQFVDLRCPDCLLGSSATTLLAAQCCMHNTSRSPAHVRSLWQEHIQN